MSGSRVLSGLFAMVLMLSSGLAWAAGQYLEMRFERSRYRAMGGVDIVNDYSTPANGALGGGLRLTVLGIDMYSTVSEGFRAARFGYDLWETTLPDGLSTEDDLRELEEHLTDLVNRVKGSTFHLELQTRVDLLNFMINKGPWTVQIGGYSEGLGGARFHTPRRIQFVDAGADSYVDIGEDIHLLRAGARLDNGVALGVGYAIPFNERATQLAVGARFRGFYRVSLPEHSVSSNAHIRTENDITFPREVSMERGWGFGLDLYTTLHFSEDLTGFRVGAYVEDVVTHVWRGDKNFFVPPRFGVGFAWISPDGKFTIGSDLERVEAMRPTWTPTWQIGMSYRAGNEGFAIVPKLGFILNHRDIVTTDLSPAMTGGLELNLGVMNLGMVAEYHTATKAVNGGLSLLFGF